MNFEDPAQKINGFWIIYVVFCYRLDHKIFICSRLYFAPLKLSCKGTRMGVTNICSQELNFTFSQFRVSQASLHLLDSNGICLNLPILDLWSYQCSKAAI